MSVAPVLRTARTRIRLAEPDDASMLLAFRTQNRAQLAPCEPLRGAGHYTLEDCRRVTAEVIEAALRGCGYALLILGASHVQVVATCGFTNTVRGPFQACHLGHAIAAPWQGHGLMHEALEAGSAWVCDVLGLHRVMANHMPRNERSARLLARLGFERDGYARDYLKIAGRWEDHVLTAEIRDDL